MKIVKTEGIIVGETNYSESSKILKILTKDYGLISVMSKGCRNIKSKLRGVSGKLVYGNFNLYYKEGGISTLISADVLDTLKNVITDINKISYVSYILDLTEQIFKEVELTQATKIYELLISVIKKINEMYDEEILVNIYELKLLDFLGIRPNIDGCSICGSTKNIVTISSNSGGYVCQNCYQDGRIYSSKTIQLIRMFFYVDVSKITKLELSSEIKKELNEFITDYYDQYSGLYLKSKNFLKNLSKIG